MSFKAVFLLIQDPGKVHIVSTFGCFVAFPSFIYILEQSPYLFFVSFSWHWLIWSIQASCLIECSVFYICQLFPHVKFRSTVVGQNAAQEMYVLLIPSYQEVSHFWLSHYLGCLLFFNEWEALSYTHKKSRVLNISCIRFLHLS